MKIKFNWAKTASLTVCAALVLAVHDITYRPAFVQIAMMAMVAAKAQAEQENDDTSEDDNEQMINDQMVLEIEDSVILIESSQPSEPDS